MCILRNEAGTVLLRNHVHTDLDRQVSMIVITDDHVTDVDVAYVDGQDDPILINQNGVIIGRTMHIWHGDGMYEHRYEVNVAHQIHAGDA